jgi:branched-chain amino acid transport system permease protein
VRNVLARRNRWELLAVVVLVVVIVLVGHNTAALATTAAFTLVFTILGQSWNVISGLAGPLALGQAAFFGLSDFLTLWLNSAHHVNQYVGILLGILASVVIAGVVGLATLRLPSFFFAIASLMVPLVLQALVLYYGFFQVERPFSLTSRPGNFYFTGVYSYVLIGAVLVVAAAVFTAVLAQRRIGRYFVAIRENTRAAEASGVPTFRYKIYAFLIASVLAAIAGALYGQLTFVFDPLDAFDPSVSIEALVVVLVGGAGTVVGPVLGAMIVVPAAQLARTYLHQAAGLDQIGYAVLLLIVAMWFPSGAYPTVAFHVRRALQRRRQSDGVPIPDPAAPPRPPGRDEVLSGPGAVRK